MTAASEPFIASRPATRAGLVNWLRKPGNLRLLIIIAVFVLWELAARTVVNPVFLPPLSAVILGLPDFFAIRGMAPSLLLTAYEILVAFSLAVVVGTGIGVALGFNRFLNQAFMPIVMLIYATPNSVFLPIFMLLFGIGVASKIAYGFAGGVFPIIITVAAGIANLRPILVSSARSMGANQAQVFRHVIFPHMLPNFFTAMRLGMATTVLGVILSELFVSQAGIGHFTRVFSMTFQTVNLYGLILVVTSFAVLINEILRRQEDRFSRWRD
jgi:ABC-type nitrate/sulfonate/bicarbonate transport system permease component